MKKKAAAAAVRDDVVATVDSDYYANCECTCFTPLPDVVVDVVRRKIVIFCFLFFLYKFFFFPLLSLFLPSFGRGKLIVQILEFGFSLEIQVFLVTKKVGFGLEVRVALSHLVNI